MRLDVGRGALVRTVATRDGQEGGPSPRSKRARPVLLRPTALLLAGGLLAACQASPPERRDGRELPPNPGPYAGLAICTPPQGATPPSCPGSSCASNATGAPDGQVVDLAACAALDLVFTGGAVIVGTSPEQPSLEVTFGALAGATWVEGSVDGASYVLIGVVAERPEALPYGVDKNCVASVSGKVAQLKLTRCHPIGSVGHLRLSADPATPGRATVDAVKALVFQPAT